MLGICGFCHTKCSSRTKRKWDWEFSIVWNAVTSNYSILPADLIHEHNRDSGWSVQIFNWSKRKDGPYSGVLTVGPCLGHPTAVFHLGGILRAVEIYSGLFRCSLSFWRQPVTTVERKEKAERNVPRDFKKWDACWSWMIDPYLLGFVCRRHNKYVVISTSELSTNWKSVLCGRTGDAITEKRCIFMSLASLFIIFFFWLEVFFRVVSSVYFPR